MKVGLRKPSIKKSISAKTTGKLKRQVKKSVNPLYGKKGMGLINDPKKAVYNKVYDKTTIGVSDLVKTSTTGSKQAGLDTTPQEYQARTTSPATWKACGVFMKVLAVVTALLLGLPGLFAGMYALLVVALVVSFGLWFLGSAWSKKAKEKP